VVNTLYIGLISSALAIALAFGQGGREVAAQITRSCYENGRTAPINYENDKKADEKEPAFFYHSTLA
jgi:hypothetical protein